MAVLFIVTNCDKLGNTGKSTGSFLPEIAHPYETFKNAGLEMTLCSPKGGEGPIDPLSMQLFKEDQICINFLADEGLMTQLRNTAHIKDIDVSKYKVIYYVGGHGPMYDFVDNELLINATKEIYEAGGIVAGICHGPVAFLNVILSNGSCLLNNQSVTSFTNAEEGILGLRDDMPFLLETKLVQRGANFVAGEPWKENVVVSGRIITGQNPASAIKMSDSIVTKLKEIQ